MLRNLPLPIFRGLMQHFALPPWSSALSPSQLMAPRLPSSLTCPSLRRPSRFHSTMVVSLPTLSTWVTACCSSTTLDSLLVLQPRPLPSLCHPTRTLAHQVRMSSTLLPTVSHLLVNSSRSPRKYVSYSVRILNLLAFGLVSVS